MSKTFDMGSSTTPAPMTHCGECGMLVYSHDYHPYAACLMFKASGRKKTVIDNLAAVRESAAEAERSRADALALQLRQVQDASRELVAISDARIAELEAVVGRCEALVKEWDAAAQRSAACGEAAYLAAGIAAARLRNVMSEALRGQDAARKEQGAAQYEQDDSTRMK